MNCDAMKPAKPCEKCGQYHTVEVNAATFQGVINECSKLQARVAELEAEVKQQSERLAVYYDIERSLDAQIDELKDQLRLVKEASHE